MRLATQLPPDPDMVIQNIVDIGVVGHDENWLHRFNRGAGLIFRLRLASVLALL